MIYKILLFLIWAVCSIGFSLLLTVVFLAGAKLVQSPFTKRP